MSAGFADVAGRGFDKIETSLIAMIGMGPGVRLFRSGRAAVRETGIGTSPAWITPKVKAAEVLQCEDRI